ncbi:protein eva-1 homolog C-like isoform X3 [Xyrauchen texanus]|uniref:protein eva-1 homolog C-like isoform X3 n=1 Tax=Xyrauchen texanus TaxID=154827 RepID=UPI002241C72E|nr:protein eva-1 homolog C-like isoform X3 [Xyrauchen texanus]
MLPPWSSCWSLCFLFIVLVVNTHHASSAPDFSDYLHNILRNHTAHACNGETLSIRCPIRTSVAVLSAFYGRRVPSQYLCPPNANPNTTVESTNCISTTAIQKIMSECQDRRECQIPVMSPVFGQDPCPETSKYAIVSYKCKPEHHRSRTVCENERLKLACKNDTVLAIYSATFGHLVHDSLGCPQEAKTKPDIECLSPSALRRVSRKCHGRTNCSVIADAQSFGDPCFPGTRKHLRVSFTCVPQYLLEDVGRGKIDPFLLSDYTHESLVFNGPADCWIQCPLPPLQEGGIWAPVYPGHKTFSPTLWKSFPRSRVFQRQWLYTLSLVYVLVCSSCCACLVSSPP